MHTVSAAGGRLLLLALLLLAAGCANPYRSYYVDMAERLPDRDAILAPAPEPGAPRLVSSASMESDIPTMLENGYLLVGKVAFRSSRVDESQALEQAREVGADVVMVAREFTGTVTQSVPITEWLPERRYTTTERTTVTRGDTDPTVRERTITQVIQGEAQVRYVPQAVDYYSYSATFWRKTRPALFGVYVQPLDEATRRQLQSNRGVIVKIVVNRSPAFDADILRGDIITRFAGEPVADPADLFAKIKRLAGREVTVTLVRNSAAREITVRLRDGN